MEKYIIVTNWEKIDKDDSYLSDEWLGKNEDLTQGEAQKIRQSADNGEVYEAFIVPALSFAIYWQMDAQRVLIDSDFSVIVWCEGAVIGTDFNHKQEFEY